MGAPDSAARLNRNEVNTTPNPQREHTAMIFSADQPCTEMGICLSYLVAEAEFRFGQRWV
ncbi:MAG: hypothetical protein CL912_12475 [Deltaproteobacteria bacterium]|nr:hypothetical protein [Deltaproteobacteria bacterium]